MFYVVEVHDYVFKIVFPFKTESSTIFVLSLFLYAFDLTFWVF